MTCPHCGESARFKGYRGRSVISLVGAIRIERAYYHCGHCRCGNHPGEMARGLASGDLTPAAREVVCMAGILGSFADAADDVLRRLAGLRVGESSVQRHTEATGRELGERLGAGHPDEEPELHRLGRVRAGLCQIVRRLTHGEEPAILLVGCLGSLAPIADFNPLVQMASGVYLAFFGSFVFGTQGFPLSDVPSQKIAVDVAAGRLEAKLSRVFRFEKISEAHRVVEANGAGGKMVVVRGPVGPILHGADESGMAPTDPEWGGSPPPCAKELALGPRSDRKADDGGSN